MENTENKIDDILRRRGALHIIEGHNFYSEKSVKSAIKEALSPPSVEGETEFNKSFDKAFDLVENIGSKTFCPTCGSEVGIGGDDKEGTHYYIPIQSNSGETTVSDEEEWICNNDCPDVNYGNCCHPNNCKKERLTTKRESEREKLEAFLKFVDEKTYFFEDKDVTIKQVVTEFINQDK